MVRTSHIMLCAAALYALLATANALVTMPLAVTVRAGGGRVDLQ